MIGDLFDSPWKILIVAVVIIVLFGSRKLPDAARSLGRSMRILKTEVQGMHDDEPAGSPAAPAQLQAAAPSAPGPQEEIANLQKQLNDLQQQSTASTNGEAPAEAKQTH